MPKGSTIGRILGGLVLGILVLLAAGWLAFVPSTQEPGYEFVKAWGGAGASPVGEPGETAGELGRPMNLTIQGGELYVPEYFNDRIRVFGLDGTPKRIIGKLGESGADSTRLAG